MTDLPPPGAAARLVVGALGVVAGLTALLVVAMSSVLAVYVGVPPWAVVLVVGGLGWWLVWGLVRVRREARAARLRRSR